MTFNREGILQRLEDRRVVWDLVVIGGGATGTGVALDAAARGYQTVLLERADFGAGTSSRSTKLVHGGVRYLRQAHIGLVFEALHERSRLLENAPHLVHDLAFVVPCYRRRDLAFYGAGLKAYDLLAGRTRFGHSKIVGSDGVLSRLPTLTRDQLRGGVVYHDGQFDDARLVIHLAMTAVSRGATVLNYMNVTGLLRASGGAVNGVIASNGETGAEYLIQAKAVVNAAGPFCDEIRQLAKPSAQRMIAASQGSHIVLNRSFLPGDSALLIPETPDGRVLFAIPWRGHTLVGTTDVALGDVPREPMASSQEIEYILETASKYFTKPPQKSDILSTFSGIRPLVKAGGGSTASLSRDYTLQVEEPGLLTLTGGKWTTYRAMAEACVDRVAELAQLPRAKCITSGLHIHGYDPAADQANHLSVYGTDAAEIRTISRSDPSLAKQLHSALPYTGAEVVWAVRAEQARTVADVLGRRTRALFLNAQAAIEMAPRVSELMARELGRDEEWIARQNREFSELARGYCAK
jgi:glycerol-3-phosphate dehydrogenase